jgi:hypothetical protein
VKETEGEEEEEAGQLPYETYFRNAPAIELPLHVHGNTHQCTMKDEWEVVRKQFSVEFKLAS